MAIHATAIVDPKAELGTGVEIGPYAIVGPDVRIGDGCRIGPHVVLYRGTRLGAGCRVHAHAVVADVPQDLKFTEVESYVEIGPESVIREGAIIHRGTREHTATVVGRGCFLMGNSHLAHNVRLGDHVILVNGVLLAGDVEIGDRAFLSGNVLVHQFTRIGRLAMISGGGAIGKDVPPFCTTAAVQRNAVTGLNVVGMRRAGLSGADRLQVKRAFDLLYRSGLNVSQALERMKVEFPSGPAAEWIPFIEKSHRGICPMGGDAGGEGD